MAKKIELLSAHYETIDGLATAALAGGDLTLEGVINCFTLIDVVDTENYAGVSKCEKALGEKAVGALASGAAVYWVNANSNIAGAGDILLGYANEAALSADTHVNFAFDGSLAFAKL